jgi:hypothetical protein
MRFERLAAAADASVALRAVRRVTDTSLLASTATAILRPVQYRSQDDAAIRRLFHSSRLMTSIDRAFVSVAHTWERARRESSLCSIAGVDLPERISFAGVALVALVVTNVMLAVGFGMPMGLLAWLLRAGWVAFGVLCSRYPERVAAAWEVWRGHA